MSVVSTLSRRSHPFNTSITKPNVSPTGRYQCQPGQVSKGGKLLPVWPLWRQIQDQENPEKAQGQEGLWPTFSLRGLQQELQVGGNGEEPHEILCRHLSQMHNVWKGIEDRDPDEVAHGTPHWQQCILLWCLWKQIYKAGWFESAQEKRSRWSRRLCLWNMWRYLQQPIIPEGPQKHPFGCRGLSVRMWKGFQEERPPAASQCSSLICGNPFLLSCLPQDICKSWQPEDPLRKPPQQRIPLSWVWIFFQHPEEALVSHWRKPRHKRVPRLSIICILFCRLKDKSFAMHLIKLHGLI